MHTKRLAAGRIGAARAGGRRVAPSVRSPASDTALPVAGSCTCSRVRVLARRLTGLYDAALAAHGLTVTQYATLVALARGEAPLAVSELARRLQMDRTTTSRLVGPLELAGWVARGSDRAPGDARARPLRITAKGRRVLQAANPAWHAVQARVDALLGETLKQTLHRATRSAGQALAVAAIEAAPGPGRATQRTVR
jgi:DNA-binding MarR family transcriptional regulator